MILEEPRGGREYLYPSPWDPLNMSTGQYITSLTRVPVVVETHIEVIYCTAYSP